MIDPSNHLRDNRRLRIRLGLLAVAQTAFALACSPNGVRSGSWAVFWLRDPDALVFFASGAMLAHPLVLYPLWAGVGPGNLWARTALTGLACGVFVGAYSLRGWQRGYGQSEVVFIFVAAALVGLITLGVRLAERRWGWRINATGRCETAQAAFRPQFHLRRLLEAVALVGGLLTLYRLSWPDGIPAELWVKWQRELVRAVQATPFLLLLIIPTAIVPLSVLADEGRRTWTLRVVAACLVGLAAGVVWLDQLLGLTLYFGRPFQAWAMIHLGASAAGFASSIILRIWGYRILRPASRVQTMSRSREASRSRVIPATHSGRRRRWEGRGGT